MAQLKEYRVPFEAAESEFVEKRSRFIGHIWRVETEEEAQEKIKQMKAKYHDARHNCWAYQLHEGGIMRYSDDGEPQGTAGMPILEVLRREEIYNVCCVVTRYFGGILLGTGGLTRAYSKGAKDALVAAGASTMQLWTPVQVGCPYALFEQVKRLMAASDAIITDTEFGADILISAQLPYGKEEGLDKALQELSAGSLALLTEDPVFTAGPREEI